MAHDNISLGDGVTVGGRLLGGEQASGAGAVTLIHDTVNEAGLTCPRRRRGRRAVAHHDAGVEGRSCKSTP